MSVARRYVKLDDVGFVGFQKYRSKAQIKKDAARTARFIKAHKAKKKSLGTSRKRASTLATAK
jgi:hypothetical protein